VHGLRDIFRESGSFATNFIGISFVASDNKPVFAAVACAGLKNRMEFLYKSFG